MTDWKARCAELADRLDDALTYTVQSDTERTMRQLIARTRAELAQPEPEGGGSIHGLEGEIVATIRAYASVEPQVGTSRILHESGFGVVARAVLTRFGRPAIEPVPVGKKPWEREGWCDAEGRCWMVNELLEWAFRKQYKSLDSYYLYGYTHLLPYWALPVPTSQETTNA